MRNTQRSRLASAISFSGMACVVLAYLAFPSRASHAAYTATEGFQTIVFSSGTEGYHTFRIPTIVKAANGDLLAIAEGRKNSNADSGDVDIVMKRSTNGGRSWSNLQLIQDDFSDTIGNPTPVVDMTDPLHPGRIWMAFCRNNDRVFVTYSDDHGTTWANRAEITLSVKDPTWDWYATGPVHGIQLQRGSNAGRLIIPSDHKGKSWEARYGSHVIYSDDHGQTWQIGADDTRSGTDTIHPSENVAVELVDGRVYFNTRDNGGLDPATRAIAYSSDGGENFDAPFAAEPNIVSPEVQNSAIRFAATDMGDADNILLYLSPGSWTGRQDLTLLMSFDEGQTWTNDTLIHSGPSAYSDLVKLDGEHVGVLYEGGSYLYGEIIYGSFAVKQVPEPSSVALLIIAGLGLYIMARVRRNAPFTAIHSTRR